MLHSGWMEKIGGGTSTFGRKNWKKRWFVLRPDVIRYYATEADTEAAHEKLLGEITLDVDTLLHVEDRKMRGNKALSARHGRGGAVPHFLLTTDRRVYELRAPSAESHDGWDACIKQALAAVHMAAEPAPKPRLTSAGIVESTFP